LIALLLAAAPALALPPHEAASAARDWRTKHEKEIIAELSALVAIPNLASDRANIERNATAISEAFTRRGAVVKLLRMEGAPPVVLATINVGRVLNPSAAEGGRSAAADGLRTRPTYTFYAHYDGQPVDPAQWLSPPWEPVLRGTGPEARLYGRSSSDDKAPIVAMLAALDALRAARAQPSVNLKFVFEGEEEAGSPHLAGYINQYRNELATDGWLLCDGPVHQSRHTQLYFGARGVTDLEITVYGPARPLHSGHYGNWAPNPIVTLTHLIDSMRDADARILIEHFYDDVTPLTGAERDALAAIPPYDENLERELALGRVEGSLPLNEAILQPALNLRGILGGHVGELASNTISTEARASIDFRLVPAQTPERVRQLVEAHIAKQGFFVVHDDPDAATRTAHPSVAKLVWGAGYPAARTAIDAPLSRRVANVISQATGVEAYRLPSLGGSVPMYLFADGGRTPVVGVPIVNHDNNQHAANENVRIQNLWDGIEIFAALFGGLR
jgi:acetylornithine deacetylase/succinyl-diaminopimelate desuccinylase-like protein